MPQEPPSPSSLAQTTFAVLSNHLFNKALILCAMSACTPTARSVPRTAVSSEVTLLFLRVPTTGRFCSVKATQVSRIERGFVLEFQGQLYSTHNMDGLYITKVISLPLLHLRHLREPCSSDHQPNRLVRVHIRYFTKWQRSRHPALTSDLLLGYAGHGQAAATIQPHNNIPQPQKVQLPTRNTPI